MQKFFKIPILGLYTRDSGLMSTLGHGYECFSEDLYLSLVDTYVECLPGL